MVNMPKITIQILNESDGNSMLSLFIFSNDIFLYRVYSDEASKYTEASILSDKDSAYNLMNYNRKLGYNVITEPFSKMAMDKIAMVFGLITKSNFVNDNVLDFITNIVKESDIGLRQSTLYQMQDVYTDLLSEFRKNKSGV